jgi:ankyrin repeat protein
MHGKSSGLVRASQQGDLVKVRKLVEAGVDVKCSDEHGMGSLLTFTPSVIEYLLAMGADPNGQKNENGAPVLSGMAYKNNVDYIRRLLGGGADPNDVGERTGETALHSLLARAGEDVSSADCQAVVQLLMEHGADSNRCTIPGMMTFSFLYSDPWRAWPTRLRLL